MDKEIIQAFFVSMWGFIKGALIVFLGPLNMQIGYLLIMIALDLYLGSKAAKKDKTFKFKYAFSRTIEKVIVYMIWIAIFNGLDMIADLPGTTRWLAILALFGQEIVSALRNTVRLGYVGLAQALAGVYKTASPIKTNVDASSLQGEEGKSE